jgi:ABC-type uncharacterized transport system permease subunit
MTAASVPPRSTRFPQPSRGQLIGAARTGAAVLGALAIFGLLVTIKGADAFTVYHDVWDSLFSHVSVTGTLVKSSPIILAALAVTVPAKAGLVNVGGEGQLIIGGVAAAGVYLAMGPSAPGGVVLIGMAVAAALAGALWAGLAAVLRLKWGINEAVSTLLLNYVALNVMYFLIYDRWKDPHGSGQPATRPLPVAQRLPLIGTSKVHTGLIVSLVAVVVVAWVLKSTRWGFKLRVVGGNSEAARRAGMTVGMLILSSMAIGGALAGLGGFSQLAGAEFKLRPDFLVTYGYTAFLASWLARHRPYGVALAAILLAGITVAGDSLQIDSQLPAACVNILMALLLLATFGWSRKAVAA